MSTLFFLFCKVGGYLTISWWWVLLTLFLDAIYQQHVKNYYLEKMGLDPFFIEKKWKKMKTIK